MPTPKNSRPIRRLKPRAGTGKGEARSLAEIPQAHVDALFYKGASALLDGLGLTAEEALFLVRDERMKLRQSILEQEFKAKDTLEARARFMIRRRMFEAAPRAVAVLERALEGPKYLRTESGLCKRGEKGQYLYEDPGVLPAQVKAAEILLRELNVGDFRLLSMNVPVHEIVTDPERALMKVQEANVVKETEESGETKEQRALSRERVRIAIELFMPALQRAIENHGTKGKGLRARATVDIQSQEA